MGWGFRELGVTENQGFILPQATNTTRNSHFGAAEGQGLPLDFYKKLGPAPKFRQVSQGFLNLGAWALTFFKNLGATPNPQRRQSANFSSYQWLVVKMKPQFSVTPNSRNPHPIAPLVFQIINDTSEIRSAIITVRMYCQLCFQAKFNIFNNWN